LKPILIVVISASSLFRCGDQPFVAAHILISICLQKHCVLCAVCIVVIPHTLLTKWTNSVLCCNGCRPISAQYFPHILLLNVTCCPASICFLLSFVMCTFFHPSFSSPLTMSSSFISSIDIPFKDSEVSFWSMLFSRSWNSSRLRAGLAYSV